MFSLIGSTSLSCNSSSLVAKKEWLIYRVSEQTGLDLNSIKLINNPTINYAELVIQPKTLLYGLYRFVYTVIINNLTYKVDTFVQIVPSGLVLSTLSLSKGIYGGSIKITRGQNQSILFNPFLNSYDTDSLLVITTLNFKYSCQIIDSNVESGHPKIPGTNTLIYMDDFNYNTSLQSLQKCFNTTG